MPPKPQYNCYNGDLCVASKCHPTDKAPPNHKGYSYATTSPLGKDLFYSIDLGDEGVDGVKVARFCSMCSTLAFRFYYSAPNFKFWKDDTSDFLKADSPPPSFFVNALAPCPFDEFNGGHIINRRCIERALELGKSVSILV